MPNGLWRHRDNQDPCLVEFTVEDQQLCVLGQRISRQENCLYQPIVGKCERLPRGGGTGAQPLWWLWFYRLGWVLCTFQVQAGGKEGGAE
jgi:hypothetical protein